jgi:predicted dehydrogenase
VATEDAVQLLLRTDQGAAGSAVISQVSPGRKNRLWFEIDGAEHSVSFDQENPETLVLGGRGHTETLVRDPAALSPEAARLSPVPAGHPLGYRDCFASFVADVYDAVRRLDADGVPAEPPYPTFADAARTARITEAVLRSAATRTWMEVH